jgi:hypothetical protein
MPNFQPVGDAFALNKTVWYEAPEEATHVGVKAGQVRFAKSDCPADFRGSKWKYFLLRGKQVSFPNYFGPDSGGGKNHDYGKPVFT